jgi:hypothetical protein
MDKPLDACWFSVLSCPCANQLGPRWLTQFDFIFLPFQPLDLPKKNVGIFFWTHLTALTPPHSYPTAYIPPTNPNLLFFSHTFSPTYFKWPSLIPTYLPSGSHIPTYLPIYPYTPTNVLHNTQVWGNVDQTRCRSCNPRGVVKWWNLMKILHFIM